MSRNIFAEKTLETGFSKSVPRRGLRKIIPFEKRIFNDGFQFLDKPFPKRFRKLLLVTKPEEEYL
ncbi:hypothetical protein LEP1GSC103_0553 [Leptospira borgpetersenii serovar Javanica str. UI 09931]|uniref:Uncharacterized protein n=3 Tax=Leptospira borgpetersenii TaxID=174 RepID=A0ABN0HT66_LEPBO|nr:hypothetical protein LEP1GSC128_1217 [Leptospira borgpetersenii str. 200801926]EKQ93454.1 hypothetical protein LEP1GSC101_0551 [Leptospira borgpetersenii str. UI 09149]EMN14762.1 hypothetical protein LEP1GSC055_2761 [Leptospira borgpetersenii str. Brem 307]EMN15874.1 hypothetical protein LEP1GSC056_3710 [Leptospira borgpetersenii str. Brem 328]EPG55889.1 hypothetical protein LEP1GSC103_0553 [Leptospira borgpetersenii serovar Javanica str. UI 09931]OOV46443.1 hypothetical protein B1H38_01335